MYLSAALVALGPATLTTVTSTVPAVPAGALAVIEVAELTMKAAGAEPKSTALPLPKPGTMKPVPVIATEA